MSNATSWSNITLFLRQTAGQDKETVFAPEGKENCQLKWELMSGGLIGY